MSAPGPLDPDNGEEEEERRRRRKRRKEQVVDSSDSVCDVCDLCDGCNLMRLSTLMSMVAATHPPPAAVLAGIAFYRRRLTRYTGRCPSTPSCSAYAVDAVHRFGARDGLRAAAVRIRSCSDRVKATG